MDGKNIHSGPKRQGSSNNTQSLKRIFKTGSSTSNTTADTNSTDELLTRLTPPNNSASTCSSIFPIWGHYDVFTDPVFPRELYSSTSPQDFSYAKVKWQHYLYHLEKRRLFIIHMQAESLYQAIVNWRNRVSDVYHRKPAEILSDYLLHAISYVVSTGNLKYVPVSIQALKDSGVHPHVAKSLYNEISSSLHEPNGQDYVPRMLISPESSMVFDDTDDPYVPIKFYRDEPYWVVYSRDRFQKGDDPTAIAINYNCGRPIKTDTVVHHILTSVSHGGARVSLKRLGKFSRPPTKEEWSKLNMRYEAHSLSLSRDSISRQELQAFLWPMISHLSMNCDQDHLEFMKWLNLLVWFRCLKATRYNPKFEGDT